MGFMSENRPDDWPQNAREGRLDCIWDKLDDFEKNPTYKTREILLSLVNDSDLNQFASYGLVRFTEYEAEIINLIYARATQDQINSVKVYLYSIITEATRLQKIMSWSSPIIGKNEEDTYRIKPYEEILMLPLKLYHFAYQKYTVLKDATFADQLMSVVKEVYDDCKSEAEVDRIAYAFSAMLNDLSYMRGGKKEKIWELERDELYSLFEMEAKLLKKSNQNPVTRPTRGVLMTQISNFILKSRNDYNQDYICKYLPREVAADSVNNHEIWMRKTQNLNDKREQKVILELFSDESWINYTWAKDIDFTPKRTYFVSSFSKSINNADMQGEYGDCLYGYKTDRIADLIGPLMIQTMIKQTDAEDDLPNKKIVPAISQVIAFDVIYNQDAARNELQYLFKVIDLFEMSDEEKHEFLQDILQYWILTVKDDDWQEERERRYVLFLYDEYDYLEMIVEDGFLKEKTSIFLLPDFIVGDNPVKEEIKFQLESKQKCTMTREYMHCHNCLVQDYDVVHSGLSQPESCPICGSKDIEIIYPDKQQV